MIGDLLKGRNDGTLARLREAYDPPRVVIGSSGPHGSKWAKCERCGVVMLLWRTTAARCARCYVRAPERKVAIAIARQIGDVWRSVMRFGDLNWVTDSRAWKPARRWVTRGGGDAVRNQGHRNLAAGAPRPTRPNRWHEAGTSG